VYQTLGKKPHVCTRHRKKLHRHSRNHIRLHICLKYPYCLNNQITLSTHPKWQQQADHHPKQQTSQKQKTTLTATTMTTGHPGKKSAEEDRKGQTPKTTKVTTMKRISRKKETITHLR
jgi:hypothetical protein